MSKFRYIAQALLTLYCAFFLIACKQSSEAEKVSQSIVRVNGQDITIHQLNAQLEQAGIQSDANNEVSKKIVNVLIEQQMLTQQAYEAKLDRNPRIMQAIEDAKSKILAQAYLINKMSTVAKPTKTEVSDYLTKHPELFSNRKQYVMNEVVFGVDSAMQIQVQALSKRAQTFEDVTQWLVSNQIEYINKQSIYSSESIPPDLLNKLSNMQIGDLIFIKSDSSNVVSSLQEVKDATISGKTAEVIAERMISDQRNKQFADDEIKRLRSIAKIEYVNKTFEAHTLDAKENSMNQTKTISEINSATSKNKEPIVQPSSEYKDENYIEKGVSGL
jgi:peptidyl-prolyl cis-trans isomerase C